MKKIFFLIKASMTQNMNLFVIKQKGNSKKTKIVVPAVLSMILLFYNWGFSTSIIEELTKTNSEYVLLIIYVLATAILTLVEGIYKASGLLFNCKDDNLLFSLPIKRSTVLFIRIFKFYLFELMYNTLFLLPAMGVYAVYTKPSTIYYFVSILALLLLPIIPIVISCIFGGIISFSSSRFKSKNLVQIFITTIILTGVLFLSFNMQNLLISLAQNAVNISSKIAKIYYPAGLYVRLATNFNIVDLMVFVILHIGLLALLVLLLGKVYFNINSKAKSVKTKTKSSKEAVKIKTNKPIKALIKKEFNRFINIPVFVINSYFGVFLYVLMCIVIAIKFNNLSEQIDFMDGVTIPMEQIKAYTSVLSFGLIALASFMSSITCSMISIEGKSFSISKSLPLKPFTILLSKVAMPVLVMIPCILIGDIVLFIKFRFTIIQIIMLLIATLALPILSETIGIIINLKYPKMDAENDAQVVKQSMSSAVAVLLGMFLTMLTFSLLFVAINLQINPNITLITAISITILIDVLLLTYLNKKGTKKFNSIQV